MMKKVKLVKPKREPRGAFTVAQLLTQIDPVEIERLNDSVKRLGDDKVGNEVW